jgi:hypothetical protein
VDDAFGCGLGQAAHGVAERSGCLFGILGFNGGLKLFDKVLDAGLDRTVSKASLLGLTGGFKHILVDDRHSGFLTETEQIRNIGYLLKSRKHRYGR